MTDGSHRFRLDPRHTRVDATAFVARGATVVGDVVVGREASIWFGAVLRGDSERIEVGPRANVQDGTVIHADPGYPAVLEEGVTVGHRCVVHGARVGRGSLLGMGSILMNGAEIGAECLVGAGALVLAGRHYAPRHLILGSPARSVRPLTDEELGNLRHATTHYVELGRAFRAEGWQDAAFPGT